MLAKIKLYLKRTLKIAVRILLSSSFGYLGGLMIWIWGCIPFFLIQIIEIIISFTLYKMDISGSRSYSLTIDFASPLWDFWLHDLTYDIITYGAVVIGVLLGLYPAIKNPDIGIFDDF